MSTVQVPVARVEELKVHPNADALEIATVLGWQCVVKKGDYSVNEPVVFFPPDTVLPQFVSDKFGVTSYLSKQRVRAVRLRGEPSFGLVMPLHQLPSATWQWPLDFNAADYFGARKYEPPVRISSADAVPENALFPRFTDIENLRHNPHVFKDGEPVVATEKIHGTNSRIGFVQGALCVGSRRLQRKTPPIEVLSDEKFEIVQDTHECSLYSFPLTLGPVRDFLNDARKRYSIAVLYGEIYGPAVQELDYGCAPGELRYRAFDLLIDGVWQQPYVLNAVCAQFGIPQAPVLYEGPYSLDKVHEVAQGLTTLDGKHTREGVVVRPVEERRDPRGRVIYKYISDDYLLAKEKDAKLDTTDA